MAARMPDERSCFTGVQETQPPGQVLNGRHFLTPTITPGSTRPSIYVITLTPEHKILLVGDIFSLGSTNNNHPRVVPDADNNLCAHCGNPTNQ